MKKAIIIGASSGIGEALAIVLAEKNFTLGLVARRENLLLSLQKRLSSKVFIKRVDITNTEDAIRAINGLIFEMGGVDLVIINAGVGFLNVELDWEKEKETIGTNVLGFAAVANVAMHYFLKKGSGHIVGISSVIAWGFSYANPAYSASKAFVSNYLSSLRINAHRAKVPITITDIKPGYVDTPLTEGVRTFWKSSPKVAAEQIFKAICKKKKHAYITKRWRLIAWVLKVMPEWVYRKLA